VGERVNKISFVGSINREVRFRKCQYAYQTFEKKRKHVKGGRPRGSAAISSKPGKGETNNSVMLIDVILMIN